MYTLFPYTTFFRSSSLRVDGRAGPPPPATPQREFGHRFARLQRGAAARKRRVRSEEHTSELQSLMRISYAVFCLKKKKKITYNKLNEKNTTQKHTETYTHKKQQASLHKQQQN